MSRVKFIELFEKTATVAKVDGNLMETHFFNAVKASVDRAEDLSFADLKQKFLAPESNVLNEDDKDEGFGLDKIMSGDNSGDP